jgi:hypothetical protein
MIERIYLNDFFKDCHFHVVQREIDTDQMNCLIVDVHYSEDGLEIKTAEAFNKMVNQSGDMVSGTFTLNIEFTTEYNYIEDFIMPIDSIDANNEDEFEVYKENNYKRLMSSILAEKILKNTSASNIKVNKRKI